MGYAALVILQTAQANTTASPSSYEMPAVSTLGK